jgi:diguanylate cyclase (GGDEF)-like protein
VPGSEGLTTAERAVVAPGRATGPWTVAAAIVVVAAWAIVRGLESSTGARHVGSTAALVVALVLVAVGRQWVLTSRRAATADRRLDRLARDAVVDELTGLLNRKGVTADIERRLTARQPGELVAVLFCDLDRLKVVNDSLGHVAGDEVLRVAAKRLSALVRDTDSVGRFGGDEFVIVTSGLPTARDLEILARRLAESLQRPTVLTDSSAQVVSGSIGIAWVSGTERTSADELLRDADVAMYRAKDDGGGRYAMFDASLRAEAVTRLELEQELRWGVRSGEIAMHYQPIVDVATGRADRLEALIRWHHPTRGTIHPGDFLPVAAESLLIVELGELVLNEACAQAVRWSELAGRPISVAVNVAERQLLDLTLVDTVTRVLATTGLPANQLELEISEELIMDRLDRSLIVLRQLDLLGVGLAIDDFGTSQASLSQLKKLAMVSTLKVDRSFVEDLATDEVDRKIVAAIVALAASVGMTVVAEGVETGEQARLLSRLGVDHLQGFLFARPAEADAITPLLVSGAAGQPASEPSGPVGSGAADR